MMICWLIIAEKLSFKIRGKKTTGKEFFEKICF